MTDLSFQLSCKVRHLNGSKNILWILGTCQKLAGGRGGWKQRGGHNFLSLRKGRGHEKWAVKRGRVMQIYARDQKESLVRKYLAHLNHLEMMSGKRKMEKKNKNLKENTMSYEEFDWMEMLNSGTLAKQHVCVLDKYTHLDK